MTGPSLKGVVQNGHHPSKKYFIEYIRNEQRLIDQNDKYMLEINKQYKFDYKHNFKLIDQEIEQLIAYIAE